MSDEESELDTLYTAPLDQFVKVRNEIAGRLKKDGDQEAAARIAALKKPSISAWAVNQLARTAALDLQRLIKAGEGLEQAQSRAMSGGDSTGFDAARRDESAAISLVRTSAKKVLPSASATLLDRIISTLRAGIATPEGRDLLKQGRLTEDIEPTGFGSFAGLSVPAAPKGNHSSQSRLQQTAGQDRIASQTPSESRGRGRGPGDCGQSIWKTKPTTPRRPQARPGRPPTPRAGGPSRQQQMPRKSETS